MKKIAFISFCFLGINNAQAQTKDRQVVANGGGFVSTPTVQVSFTVGETVTKYLSASGASLCQGFQQANNAGASIWNANRIDAQVSTYPNPFVNFIEVRSDKLLHNPTFQLIDANGKSILISIVEMQAGKYWRIQMDEIASGNYWLSIATEGNQSTYALTHLSN